jgi:hypothetical protein
LSDRRWLHRRLYALCTSAALLPADALSVCDGRVGLSANVALASESARLEQELAAAARLQGSELVAAAEDALQPLARRMLCGCRFGVGRRAPPPAD